jgi:hypothetical protein
MKKAVSVLSLALLFSTTVTFADPQSEKLDCSVEHWNKLGTFEYRLHYGNACQLMSKISVPQHQPMDLYSLQYKPDKRHFVRMEYGATKTGTNGRGDDSDWTAYNTPDILTDYGTMDFYGKESLYSIDLGKHLAKNAKQQTDFFVGWGNNKTSNELKNVVYHKVNGTDIGNVSQPDNGSYINSDFGGAHMGLENYYKINQKFSINSSISIKQMEAKAYGHWANHTPAWNWVNKGKALGYEAKIGLNYKFTKNTSTTIGYYYSYAKADRTDETLDTGSQIITLPGMVDLEYQTQGYYFSLHHKF